MTTEHGTRKRANLIARALGLAALGGILVYWGIWWPSMLGVLCGFVAAVLGTAVMVEGIRRPPKLLRWGIGILCIVLGGAVFCVGLSDLDALEARQYGRRFEPVTCLNNLLVLHKAAAAYADKHEGSLPPMEGWSEALLASIADMKSAYDDAPARIPTCPVADDPDTPTYALNGRVCGMKLADIKQPTETVLFFESISGRDLAGGPELLPPIPRHERGYAVCFANGYAKFVRKSEIGTLNWDPAKRLPPATE
jgi:hypothetical protein